jgi:SNF2 family DNA or RNA helicase
MLSHERRYNAMTFNVKIDAVRELTTNGPTYMKGRQYYRQGRVRHLSFDQEMGVILAQVEGTRAYNIRIILNGKGELHDATCTCSAFASYWGICQHIAAALLYGIDAFGEQKTNILPAKVQTQRRSRNKTREFMLRMNHTVRVAQTFDKKILRLQVTLHCSPSTTALPWLSFAVGETCLYPILNVEQFAEAISRDLPLELDKDLTIDPKLHTFSEANHPLIAMIRDAFENDYKAVFGTSHSASRDRFFTLNASRFAEFLAMSAGLPDCAWQTAEDQERQEIQVHQADLPIKLCLSYASGTKSKQTDFILSFHSEQNLQQLTASRNVYLVGNAFYLPPYSSIRLIEPILTVFSTPGLRRLVLTQDDVLFLFSEVMPHLHAICPLQLDDKIKARLVDEPLEPFIDLDYEDADLLATVGFRYGDEWVNPLSTESEKTHGNTSRLIIRNHTQENRILQILQKAGFKSLGTTYRLSDPDKIYYYLADHAPALADVANIRLSESAAKLHIRPAPVIRFELSLAPDKDQLLLRHGFHELRDEERLAYLHALREKRPFFQAPDGGFRQVDLHRRDGLVALLDLLRQWGLDPYASDSRLPRFRALALTYLLDQDGAADLLILDAPVKKMIQHLQKPGSLTFKIPAGLSSKLRPYQKTGFQWLCTLDYYGLGGILADDMGLGKTLQTIAYVAHVWRQKKKPSLIIAPTSLVYNWLSEFNKFTPRLPVMILDGNRQQRASRLVEISRYACVITSYSLLRRDIEDIGELSFASCFLDEAQNIKNPDTLNARSVKLIQAERCFALTGTLIENSLTELWSIFDFILPGYLYNQRDFQSTYEWPITRENNALALDKLHTQIDPFILRRMKRDVLKELPDKIETVTICDMTCQQRQIYESFLLRAKNDLDQEIAKNGYARSQIFILALLTRLRQICCHPGLFMSHYHDSSGKLLLLEEILQECFASGHRVLVFSQFTGMLEIIRREQIKAGCEPFYIDGQVPAEERLAQVQRFNSGEGRLFLISLRAGGTGLNLTGADTVIHFDPWWNPAVEEQATDRAYRIGQESVVQVFKLVTRDSIEEKIQHLQTKKQHLVDAVIKPGQNLLSKMTLEEVRSLFQP